MNLDKINSINNTESLHTFCLLLAGSVLLRLENMYLIWGMKVMMSFTRTRGAGSYS